MKKAEKTQLTISKILEAAMNEFGKNGYSGGTINNICSSGINKGLSYFHLMQLMLNGYFSSPAFQNTDIPEKAKIHEMTVSKLLDYMLHGIAKGEK